MIVSDEPGGGHKATWSRWVFSHIAVV
jgi:hypothetical protein